MNKNVSEKSRFEQKLPKILVSSVIRSSYQGESHGGIYLVDMEKESIEQKLDWNDGSISWEGRGGDRGLRGISFYGEEVYIAASNEIFVYDRAFQPLRSFRNRYLRHCHETHIHRDRLYLTSTGFDAVLEYDLLSKRFVTGYSMNLGPISGRFSKRFKICRTPNLCIFDPNDSNRPDKGDTLHLNSVFFNDNALYVSGKDYGRLLAISDSKVSSYAKIPYGTHNARPFRDGVIMNHTSRECIQHLTRRGNVLKSYPIKRYSSSELRNTHIPADHARQAFGRGLCIQGEYLVGGSSPATVSVYHLETGKLIKAVNLSLDIRNAIHGLEIWPFKD